MCELICGKINEKVFELDKDKYGPGSSGVSPYDVLDDAFWFTGRSWTEISVKAEEIFGNLTWFDWGSFLCRGDCKTMRKFLAWNGVHAGIMKQLKQLPEDGDYGFVYIADY